MTPAKRENMPKSAKRNEDALSSTKAELIDGEAQENANKYVEISGNELI